MITTAVPSATTAVHMPGFEWPEGFARVPAEEWVTRPLDEFGIGYHRAGGHGYYKNLDPIVAQIAVAARDGQLLIDYSGGTGLLTDRILPIVPQRFGVVNVDPSTKFLRVAVENQSADDRVAFRLLEFLRPGNRLATLTDALGPDLVARGADIIAVANAIHLYPDLQATMSSWYEALKPGGLVLINSGCLRNPSARSADWVLDDTVDRVNEVVVDLVLSEPAFAEYRDNVTDPARWAAFTAARKKVFVPLRGIQEYLDVLGATGFDVLAVSDSTIFIDVGEFTQLLCTYHESVLGWVGGVRKIDGAHACARSVRDRLFLIRYGLERMFPMAEFPCNWTYLTCRRRP